MGGTEQELPTWARRMWNEAGSPDLEPHLSVTSGPLLERRHGLRKDDLVEIAIDTRSLPEGSDATVRGRLLSSGKTAVELLCEDGRLRYVSRSIITQVTLVAHLRPAYLEDSELIEFERKDMKRRTDLQERAEKSTKGRDTVLWG